VKIVNGVITEIAPDNNENRHLKTEANSPATLYIDAPKQSLLPGFIGVLSNELNQVDASRIASEQALNDLLKLGITTLVINNSDLTYSLSLQQYSIDAKRRTPRISVGAKVTLETGSQVKSQLRSLSQFPIETLWIKPTSQNTPEQICGAVKEAAFHEFNISVLSSLPIQCGDEEIFTIASCSDSEKASEKCLMKASRKIGILPLVSSHSDTSSPINEGLGLQGSRIRALSWGAAHLTGYQDALGKIQVGYRGDLLVIAPPSLSASRPAAIQTVLIDGIPQELEPSPLKAMFWFWKTVSLGL